MKINREQWEMLNANLDAIQAHHNVFNKTWNSSVDNAWKETCEIKQRLAQLQADFKTIAPLDPNAIAERLQAIEQGQGVLCERLDGLASCHSRQAISLEALTANYKALAAKLDAIQGALLHQQFKSGKRPKRKAAKGKGVK